MTSAEVAPVAPHEQSDPPARPGYQRTRKPSQYFDAEPLQEAIAVDTDKPTPSRPNESANLGEPPVQSVQVVFADNPLGSQPLNASAPAVTSSRQLPRSNSTYSEPATHSNRDAKAHKLFGLGPDHRLRDSFSCAIQKSIVIHGRLYIFSTCIAFHSSLFGKIRRYIFPFSDIISIKKRPVNCLVVTFREGVLKADNLTPRTEALFTSFAHRDRAFRTATAEFDATFALDTPAADTDYPSLIGDPAETDSDGEVVLPISSSISGAPTPIEGGTLPQHRYSGQSRRPRSISPAVRGSYRSSRHNSVIEMPRSGTGLSVNSRAASGSLEARKESVSKIQPVSSESSPERPPRPDTLRRAPTPTKLLSWITPDDVLDRAHGQSYERKTECCRFIFPDCTPKQAFNALFVDHTLDLDDPSDFIRVARTSVGNFDVNMSPWEREPTTDANEGYMRRDVRYVHPLKMRIGPKQTACHEVNRYSFTSGGGFLYEWDQHNLDVQFGDSFRVQGFLDFADTGSGGCEVVASVGVHFLKSLGMIKRTIESGALTASKPAMEKLCELAKERCHQFVTEAGNAADRNDPPFKMEPRRSHPDMPRAESQPASSLGRSRSVDFAKRPTESATLPGTARAKSLRTMPREDPASSRPLQAKSSENPLGFDPIFIIQMLVVAILLASLFLLVQVIFSVSDLTYELRAIRVALERSQRAL